MSLEPKASEVCACPVCAFVQRCEVNAKRRRRLLRLVRRIVAAAVGGLVAWSCPRWPEELHPVCSLLAELAEVVHGRG